MKRKIGKRILSIILTGAMSIALIPVMPITKVKAADSIAIGQTVTYNYNGGTQTFTAPEYGIYTITCAGAQGGNSGSKGGIVVGNITLNANESISFTIGGTDGFNGGGAGASDTFDKTFTVGYHDCRNGVNYATKTEHKVSTVQSGNGGGATVVMKNDAQVMIGAGGAGGSNVTSPSINANSNGVSGTGSDGQAKAKVYTLEAVANWGCDLCHSSYVGDIHEIKEGSAATGVGGGGGGYYGGKAGYAGTNYIDTNQVSTIQNDYGKVQGNGYVTITYSQSLYSFTTQPQNTTVKELGNISLNVATSQDDSSSFKWQESSDGINWNNISDGSNYAGTSTTTLSIKNTPYALNQHKYRCIATYNGTSITSNAAIVTVQSGLVFDQNPSNVTVFEEETIKLQATSEYAKNHGSFQWQIKNSSGTWVNIKNGTSAESQVSLQYTGATSSELVIVGTLTGKDNSSSHEYRCSIKSNLDNLHETVYSSSATVSIMRNGYKKIIVGYDKYVEVPKIINIKDVFVSVLYDNGTMEMVNGWDNLYFTDGRSRQKTYTVNELGEQSIGVILVDTYNESRSMQETLTVIGQDTTAPEWIEDACFTEPYDIVQDSSKIKPITIYIGAEDNYTTRANLKYALVEYGKQPKSSDFSEKAVYTVTIAKNTIYVAYVKDECGNISEKTFYLKVLDNIPPVIYSFVENPDDEIVKSAYLIAYAEDGVDENGEKGVEGLTYRFYSGNENTNLANDLLDVWITGNQISITDNGTYYVDVADALGNIMTSKALKVSNLDSNPPTVDISFNQKDGKPTIIVNAKDEETLTSVASGLKTNNSGENICFSVIEKDGTEVNFEVNGNEKSAQAIIPATNNDTSYIVRVMDNAGNATVVDYVLKDTMAPVVTLNMSISEDRRYGIFKIIARDEETATSKVSGLRTDEGENLTCFEITDDKGNLVDIAEKVIESDEGIVYAASGAFKTNTTTPYTIKVTDNAGNETCITESLSGEILDVLAEGIISGIDGKNLLGTTEYPEWTQGSVQITGHIDDASQNYEWSSNYDKNNDNPTWVLGAYGNYNGINKTSYYSHIVSENGNYTVYARDEQGEIYKKSIEVSNIDNVSPTFTATMEGSCIIIDAQDEDSGIDYILIDGGSLSSIQQKDCYGATHTQIYANVSENGNYTISVYDKAGNISNTLTQHMTGVDTTEYYTVLFCNYDGSVLKSELVKEGEEATPPTNVTREGYIFNGWDQSYSNIREDRQITAIFVKDSKKTGDNSDITAIGDTKYYRVDFCNFDGSILKSERVAEHESANPPTNVKRDGYIFTGWDKSYADIQSNTIITALFMIDEKNNSSNRNGDSNNNDNNDSDDSNSSKKSKISTGSTVTNSTVGDEFDEEARETVEDNGEETEEIYRNIVILSEFTDDAMLLAEYRVLEIEDENWLFFEEEAIPKDLGTNDIVQAPNLNGKKVIALIVLLGIGGFGIFYSLNKKYYWVSLPF